MCGAHSTDQRSRHVEDRYRKFCLELISNDFNATAAYCSVYHSTNRKSAEANASRLLRNAKVQAILTSLCESVQKKQEVDAAYVIGKWLKHAEASPLDYLKYDEDGFLQLIPNLSGLPDDLRGNLRHLHIRRTDDGATSRCHIAIETVDQQKALYCLGRFLGLLKPKRSGQSKAMELDISEKIRKGTERVRKARESM